MNLVDWMITSIIISLSENLGKINLTLKWLKMMDDWKLLIFYNHYSLDYIHCPENTYGCENMLKNLFRKHEKCVAVTCNQVLKYWASFKELTFLEWHVLN